MCGACQEQTHLQHSQPDMSSPSVTAAGSSIWVAENLTSSIQRVAPGSAAQPLASATSLLALAQERFPRPSTEHGFAPSHPALESTAVGELG